MRRSKLLVYASYSALGNGLQQKTTLVSAAMAARYYPSFRVRCFFSLLILFLTAPACLSYEPRNPEVQALFQVKQNLNDPHGALSNWDEFSVDPCSWAMITCSPDNSVVVSIEMPSQALFGTLSSAIANLTNLEEILLQNNNISGEIPPEIGSLSRLKTLDLSNNGFSGDIPESLGQLANLQYMRLNNNSLGGTVPASVSSLSMLRILDLSYNNLSSPVPKLPSKTFSVVGNPLICGNKPVDGCSGLDDPASLTSTINSIKGRERSRRLAVALGTTFGVIFSILLVLGILHCRSRRLHTYNLQKISVERQEVGLTNMGNLRIFSFKELQTATNSFSSKHILGSGGFGNVYKGKLGDGGIVAVKRLKDMSGTSGEYQFQMELELISLAVHRNLLRLIGYCATPNERLLVYPYMSNGSVASRLRGKPPLDWNTRKKIAIGAARGLVYLHEQCDPKIIHRDVKAANVLLDEYYEAIVGDFGLAKLLDHSDSHVTTAVRGTVGHIAPEYLSTGQSSEKTDVFGFGILLLELITGMRALEFGKTVSQKGAMLEWVRRVQQEKREDVLVDRELGTNYERIEVGEMLQVALLCTQYLPTHRPKMSEVVRMLEGDGLAEKWVMAHGHEGHGFGSALKPSSRAAALPLNQEDDEGSDQKMFGANLDDEDEDDHTLDSFTMELSGPR